MLARKRRRRCPPASSADARRRMVANRGRDTSPERAIRSELHRLGLRYRLHRRVLPEVRRQVDIVFGPSRVAVLVDGCFWHGCPRHATQAKRNAKFWADKIATNKRRDEDTNARLRRNGWRVVRVWEHEDPRRAAARIAKIVRARIRA